ncbi:THUMP domain-containing class I SAM-dependent RNA methyltransferase [Candidatus Xianfuyuplasma coldseepsis]|uniref:Class I SAM-dependent RNA methyltransferase n=1 Tax=Candidatus Xianfuyuplasma coldseepsis TaxID=2782163 RepID=A0A7L7KP95_9MOLU|nr:class I SAM-dependent RNA methyltransferase [Xianfuyuplasma coldseepsis]QMS84601.1 class I SAM-dependent RNA methyltransferase [Xianfuyuplasma coldseepsis]
METLTLLATATFGLESVVKRELEQLGYDIISVDNGRVLFNGTYRDIVKTNLWLRTADRVLWVIGEFKATTFDQLYDQTKRLSWPSIIPKNGTTIVNGKSVKSKLFSISDCQKIVKKAIVDKLMFAHKVHWLKEDGPTYSIQVSLLKDIATITIDTSGTGLHKRGYRVETVEAPLKETLAAALIQLSYWNKDRVLYDTFCGSGTIPIEAAMIGRNIAPGLNRDFAFKAWDIIPNDIIKEETKKAYQAIDYDSDIHIYASDISEENLHKAEENAIEAGVDDCITFSVSDIKDIVIDQPYPIVISNPPYGERLMDEGAIISLTKTMKQVFSPYQTASLYFLTSFQKFEQYYGKKADRRRKLYNGRIEVWYYQYYGPRPPL